MGFALKSPLLSRLWRCPQRNLSRTQVTFRIPLPSRRCTTNSLPLSLQSLSLGSQTIAQVSSLQFILEHVIFPPFFKSMYSICCTLLLFTSLHQTVMHSKCQVLVLINKACCCFKLYLPHVCRIIVVILNSPLDRSAEFSLSLSICQSGPSGITLA